MRRKVLIGLLCATLLSGCELTTKECNCEEECKTEVKENKTIEVTKEEAYELVEDYLSFPTGNILDSGLTEKTMVLTAAQNVKNKYVYTMAGSALEGESNVTKIDGGYDVKVGTDTISIESDSDYSVYSYEGMNEAYQELFGKNIEKKDYNTTTAFWFKYSSKENVYFELVEGIGIYSALKFGVKEVKVEDNKLTVLVGYAIFDSIMGEETGGYTSNIEKGKTFTNSEVESDNFGQTMVEKYADKVSNTELVFEKQNDSYVLVSATKK